MSIKNATWVELCEYIKNEILQYDSSMKFPKHLALRLRGLKNGQFISNNKCKPMANYTDEIILYTFKVCKFKILKYLSTNKDKFNGETHIINSIMCFVEKEINDVVIRLKQVKKNQEKAENINLDHIKNKTAEYKKKSKDTRLNDLW